MAIVILETHLVVLRHLQVCLFLKPKTLWKKLNLPGILEIRRVGLVLGFDIEGCGQTFCRDLREKGVLTRPILNTVVLMPPLSINDEELGFLINAVTSILKR
jgi:adenosylmethionine-8-amino-7-oxononanoate aminotransferase